MSWQLLEKPKMETSAQEVAKSPLAVCIIVENLPVPADRRVWQEARALTKAGYQVSVICPKGRGFEQSRETLDGIQIYRHGVREASGPFAYLIEYGGALIAEFVLALRIYARTHFRVLQACNPPYTIFLDRLFLQGRSHLVLYVGVMGPQDGADLLLESI